MLQGDKQRLAARLGDRVRKLREEVGLSLKTLARATELSPSFLSRVENGRTLPSLLTLHSIARALRVDVESLFSSREAHRFVISRQDNRNRFYSIKGPGQKTCYEMELLAHEMDNPLMEPALVTALLKDTNELELTSHGGQEFCYVVEGPIEIVLDNRHFTLETGDAAYWDGTIPHGAVSLSDTPAKTLNIHIIPGKRVGSFQVPEKGSRNFHDDESERS